MLEDKRLIWKFNNGSKEALCLIYDKYKHDLLTLATSLLHDVSAGEDVVHDVFVSFIQARGKFKLTGSLKGYLATCVARETTDYTDLKYITKKMAITLSPMHSSSPLHPSFFEGRPAGLFFLPRTSPRSRLFHPQMKLEQARIDAKGEN